MSSTNPIIVNCGATHVSVSSFSANGGNLKLEKFVVLSLQYNYANEDEWLPALAATLRKITHATDLTGPAVVIVPGYRLLTKNIKVAQVERSRQQQMIAFEAQNNLPDASEMVWDGQIVATDGVEAEVVLFAHKTVDATLFVEAIRTTGIKPIAVEAATLLDYQAYRLAQKDAPAHENAADENVLLVNVGARSTNLTFVSAAGFNIQNISLGGNWLTQMLADNLGEKFPAAEELKVKYFLGEIKANPGDPLATALETQAQVFIKRLAQDISRRIIVYKRANQNQAPVKILLSGRAALLPGLRESLAESLKIETEFFEPTAALVIGPAVPRGLLESANRFQMSEAVGEAARLVLKDAVGVNLIPPEIARQMEFSKKKPYLVFAAILLAAAPFPVAWHFWNENAALFSQVKEVEADYARYNTNLNGLVPKIDSSTQGVVREDGRVVFVKSGDGILDVQKKSKVLVAHVEEVTRAASATDAWTGVLRPLQDQLLGNATLAWIETFTLLRPEPPPAPAYTSSSSKKVAPTPLPPLKISITVRTLLDDVAPGAPYSSEKDNAKFAQILEVLQKCSFVQEVEATASTGEQSSNLPSRTFVLTVNPEIYL
jgi:type IV pilus assembly protein PilM